MSELPAALRPWATELAIFPPEIQAGLGPWLLRLDAAFGRLRAVTREDAGDPDGFDGLARKGSYQRLLLTDWLLAEQVPEEFLRRAAMLEHSFLRLARQSPKGARTSAVLFDAGPFQLGGPRIAHLAILIVLARRASAAQATFRWGVLQAPAVGPFDGVSVATVQHLLSARTTTLASDEALARWADRLGFVARDPRAELWVVGGESMHRPALAHGADSVVVADVLELGARAVSVHLLGRASKPARRLLLELPEPALAARVLRDPFAAAVAKRTTLPADTTPSSKLVFSGSGSKVFARGQGALLQFPVPNSPRAGVGRVKKIQLRGLCTAVTRYRRPTLVVYADFATRSLCLSWREHDGASLGHFTSTERVHAPWEPQPSDDLRPVYAYETANELVVLYVDTRSNLFELKPTARPRLLARGVLASAPFGNGAAFTVREISGGWIKNPPRTAAKLVMQPGVDPQYEPLELGEVVAARMGTLFGRNGPEVMTACLGPAGDWLVEAGGSAFSVRVDDQRVLGVAHARGALALVTLAADQRSIRWVRPGSSEVLFVVPGRVTHAVLHPTTHTLAVTTAERALLFYSIAHGELVARFELERAA